jgi:hypothetical protein
LEIAPLSEGEDCRAGAIRQRGQTPSGAFDGMAAPQSGQVLALPMIFDDSSVMTKAWARKDYGEAAGIDVAGWISHKFKAVDEWAWKAVRRFEFMPTL